MAKRHKCIPNLDVTPAQAGAHPEIVVRCRIGNTATTLRLWRYLEIGTGLRRYDTECAGGAERTALAA